MGRRTSEDRFHPRVFATELPGLLRLVSYPIIRKVATSLSVLHVPAAFGFARSLPQGWCWEEPIALYCPSSALDSSQSIYQSRAALRICFGWTFISVLIVGSLQNCHQPRQQQQYISFIENNALIAVQQPTAPV